MLYDVPVHSGYKILTKPSSLRYEKNGLKQVGNELTPAHPIAPAAVKVSSIYNKNLSGIGEAGYGRLYPNYGLSYPGAGSPTGSWKLGYAGAGSPKSSWHVPKNLGYPGAGSPSGSWKLGYAGAGSPPASWKLRDAYINDNPPPGTLHSMSGLSRYGIPGRPSSRGRGLSGLWDDLTASASTLFQAATKSGTEAVSQKITNALTPKTNTIVATTTPAPTVTKPSSSNFLGMSAGAALAVGAAAAYLIFKKD